MPKDEKTLIKEMKKSEEDFYRVLRKAGELGQVEEALTRLMDRARERTRELAIEIIDQQGLSVDPDDVFHDEEVSDQGWDMAIAVLERVLEEWMKPMGGLPSGYQ